MKPVKRIGHRATPNSKRIFPSRKAATVINETILFHGAKLNLVVLNTHRSTSRWFRRRDWTIAADRLVRLEEDGVQVGLDSQFVSVKMRKHRLGEMPPYSHFVWELPRKLLRNFPVMLQFDKRHNFTGLVILRPDRAPSVRERKHSAPYAKEPPSGRRPGSGKPGL